MIEVLYSAWEWIAGIGTIIGIVAFVLSVTKKKGVATIVLNFLMCCGIGVAGLALSVNLLFTKVPTIEGSELSVAIHYLEEAELQYAMLPGITLADNSKEIVRWSSIESGTMVLKNTEVVLVTNFPQSTPGIPTTTEKVPVPDVLGMEQGAAVDLLESIGFGFQVWWYEEDVANTDVYYIIDQSIPAGADVEPGTVIRLQLSSTKSGE